MISNLLQKKLRQILSIALLSLLTGDVTGSENISESISPEKINLALRRTADALLRASGDSTSRIPAIEQTGVGIWQVRLKQPFSYEQLPGLLRASLEIHGIRRAYDVTVRRCEDGTIDLGYNYLDLIGQSEVACRGREMPSGCHYIEIAFLPARDNNTLRAGKGAGLLLIFGGIAGFFIYRHQKSKAPGNVETNSAWVDFGNSRLDVANQILVCQGIRQTLTFRETKLLMLFASHAGQLLERDFIIQQVWADEGVLVGRSVDVFVSRLRKKLADDPSVSLAVVHGVGYRLEILKMVS